jgi:predicted small secreted protein
MKAIFALTILALTVVACRGPGGPVERAGRTVDHAVYDVGTGIKKAGHEVQEAAQ